MQKIKKIAGVLVAGITCLSQLSVPVYGYATRTYELEDNHRDMLFFQGKYNETPETTDDILMTAPYSPSMLDYEGMTSVYKAQATFDMTYNGNYVLLSKKEGESKYSIFVDLLRDFHYKLSTLNNYFTWEKTSETGGISTYRIDINPKADIDLGCAILVSQGSLRHGTSVIRLGDLLAKVKDAQLPTSVKRLGIVGNTLLINPIVKGDIQKYLKTDLTQVMHGSESPYLDYDVDFANKYHPTVQVNGGEILRPDDKGRVILPNRTSTGLQAGENYLSFTWEDAGAEYIDRVGYRFDYEPPVLKYKSGVGLDADRRLFISKDRKITLTAEDYSENCYIDVYSKSRDVYAITKKLTNHSKNKNEFTFVLEGSETLHHGTDTRIHADTHEVTVIDSYGNRAIYSLSDVIQDIYTELIVDKSNVSLGVRDGKTENLSKKDEIVLDVKCENATFSKDPKITVNGKEVTYTNLRNRNRDTYSYGLGALAGYLQDGQDTLTVDFTAEKSVGQKEVQLQQVLNYDIKAPIISTANITTNSTDIMKEKDDKSIFLKDNVSVYVEAEDQGGSGVAEMTMYRTDKKGNKTVVAHYMRGNEVFNLEGEDGDVYQYTLEVVDKVGNKATYSLADILKDKHFETVIFDKSGPDISIAPTKNVSVVRGDEDREYIPKDTEIFITSMDKDEEVETMVVYLNDEEVYNDKTGAFSLKLSAKSVNNIKVVSTDLAGNVSTSEKVYHIDTTAPPAPTGEFVNDNTDFIVNGVKIFDSVMSFRIFPKDNEGGAGIASTTVLADGKEVKSRKGIYTLTTIPKELKVQVKDKMGNTGTYELKSIQGLVPLENIRIDKEKPVVSITEPSGKVNGNWYRSDKVYYIQAEDATALKSLNVYINGRLYANISADNKITNKLEATFDTRAREFEDDDGYNIQIVAEDITGKFTDRGTNAKIDRINPEITRFIFEGNGKIDGAEIDGEDRYGFFLNGNGKVNILAVDEGMSSGLNEVVYKLKDKDGKVYDDGKGTAKFKDNVAVIDLPKDFKGFIEAYPTDNVGHIGNTQKPDGFVNSNASINANTIDINLPESKHRDKKGLTLYPEDVKGEIVIHPNEYGWENVRWGTRINGVENLQGEVKVDRNGKLSGTTAKVTERDKNLVLDMASMLNVTDNTNDIVVWVSVTDNRGQQSYKEATFSIDKDKPVIRVDYSEDKDSGYYAQSRKATITILERNFDAKDVKIGGNNTGVSNWTSTDELTHQCTVDFSKDDNYQLTVDYKDLAGNLAQSYTSEKFTVDTTLPVMQVTFDKNNPNNGNFFAETRTATIRVNEHNFDPQKINIVGEGMKGEWHTEGDSHVMTILFGKDGSYSFEITGEDKAGNKLQPYQSESFIIDMTNPTISIEGVEDGVSHKEDIKIRVALSDNYLDAEKTYVTLESRKNGSMEMQGSVGDTTGVFTLDNIPKEQTWDDAYLLSVVVTDKAGNHVARDLTFTVNRFGSQYEVQQSDVMGKSTAVLPAEFVFKESSIDRIDMSKTTVDIARSGEEYKYDETLLQKEEEKTNEGYEYTYTLKTTAFADDGKYNVGVVSVAEDGTKNASAKNNFSFIYDTTAPKIGVSGIQSGGKYMEETKAVTVDFDDLSGVDSSTITVNGQTVELDETTDLYQKFELPKSAETYTVLVQARDLAGNESRTEIQGVIVSKDIFDIIKGYLNSGVMIMLPIAIIVIALIIFAVFAIKRRKRDNEIWLENHDD